MLNSVISRLLSLCSLQASFSTVNKIIMLFPDADIQIQYYIFEVDIYFSWLFSCLNFILWRCAACKLLGFPSILKDSPAGHIKRLTYSLMD